MVNPMHDPSSSTWQSTRPAASPTEGATPHPDPGSGSTPPSAGTARRMRFSNGPGSCTPRRSAPADPAVVLLHGAGNSMMSWDAELCEALAERGRLVVRLDARDAGRSATARRAVHSMHDIADDVVALLDALELPAATLAGVSLGGITAQIVAVEHPRARQRARADLDHARAATTCPARRRAVRGRAGAAGLDGPRRGRALPRRAGAAVRRGALRRGADDAHRRADRRPRRRPRGAARTRSRSSEARRCRDRLPEIRVPTVVVHGTEDPMFPLAARAGARRGDPGRAAARARRLRPRPPSRATTGRRSSRRSASPASTAAERGRASAASVSAQAAGERSGRAARRRRPRPGARRPPSRRVCPVDQARLVSATAIALLEPDGPRRRRTASPSTASTGSRCSGAATSTMTTSSHDLLRPRQQRHHHAGRAEADQRTAARGRGGRRAGR